MVKRLVTAAIILVMAGFALSVSARDLPQIVQNYSGSVINSAR